MSQDRPSALVLAGAVFVGAALGTAVRAYAAAAWPATPGAWPWTIFVINLAGSVALGMLLGALATSDGQLRRWTVVRAGVGTGVIGGFTTYSTFVVEVVDLVRAGHPWLGGGYALVSVVAGVVCAGVGLSCGQWLAGRAR